MAAGDVFADAVLAARLCAIDPVGLGGMTLRGDSPARDAVIAALQETVGSETPWRRVPRNIDDDRLLGGLDVAASLNAERTVSRAGLLAEADGGFVIVAMAERMGEALAARIAAVIDTGEVVVERDGLTARHKAQFGLILLDDGAIPDEHAPDTLQERLAFRFDLSDVRPPEADLIEERGYAPSIIGATRPGVRDGDLETLAATALAFGIGSARTTLFAMRAARASAALAGRRQVNDDDIILAARLVLAPRATQLPAPEAEAEAEPESNEPPPPSNDMPGDDEQLQSEPKALDDVVLDAVRAALPADLLAKIAAGAGRGRSSPSGGAGERRKSPTRGRPLGSRAGLPRGGARISLIDTLRAAAPWQKLRERSGRVVIRRDDIRIKRFENRAEATTIFAVDASGSAAIARLGEAKGAVELLLAEAYVKRTQVALIAFRGTQAELLLPPTRSLARARRSLGDLPGGGGTPLFAGLDAARQLADAVKAKGRTPFVVLLTDGRANIAADGSASRDAAKADATQAGRTLFATGTKSVFIDTGARPRPEAAELAAAMGARYLPLPRADAATMSAAIQALQS